MKSLRLINVVFLMAMMFAWMPISEAAVQLPKTGQHTCYLQDGTSIACAGTGYDGEDQAGIAWPSPRFSDNGDETLTDNLTGLIWPMDGDTPAVGTSSPCLGGDMSWQEALNYVACLNTKNYLGHGDWRLPNTNELESLISAGEIDTSDWLNSQGFRWVMSRNYWTSTTYAYLTTNYAWVVAMGSGQLTYQGKTYYYDTYVLPVRGQASRSARVWKTGQKACFNAAGAVINCSGTGQDGEKRAGVGWPAPRFTDLGNGTVQDNLTLLVWSRDAQSPGPEVCEPGTTRIWQDELGQTTTDAISYIECLNREKYLGYGDWRLPNRKELHSLIDYSRYSPALPAGHPFINVQAAGYWSSSLNFEQADTATTINLADGDISSNWRQYGYWHVWPVRAHKPTISTLSPAAITTAANAAQGFQAVYSDTAGYGHLKQVLIKVNSVWGDANGIVVKYDRSLNKLYLKNDAGTSFLATACAPGVAGTLENSQGMVNCAATTVSAAGNNLTVNWSITPKPAFASTKKIFLNAGDSVNSISGWVRKGTWTITP